MLGIGLVLLLAVIATGYRVPQGRASSAWPARVALVANLGMLATASRLPEWPLAPYWVITWLPVAAFTWCALVWRALAYVDSATPHLPLRLARPLGAALVGGETAEHPGLLAADEYDVAGAATGVVEADMVLGAERVQSGDVVIGMASSGIHSNGYSLVRRVVNTAGWSLDREVTELGRTLGEELLEPTRIYSRACLDLVQRLNGHDGGSDLPVRAFSHVTGGGLAANLARVLPQGLMATVERDTWSLPPVFRLVGELGRVPQSDLERTLNLGVGMVAVVDPEVAAKSISVLVDAGIDAWEMGTIGALTDDAAAAGLDFVQGAKGVDGGAVLMRGQYAA